MAYTSNAVTATEMRAAVIKTLEWDLGRSRRYAEQTKAKHERAKRYAAAIELERMIYFFKNLFVEGAQYVEPGPEVTSVATPRREKSNG